ncbi:CsbD family protein [Microbacterium sp. SD291]|uniref:CsbD family protein n=1 Tax=Microbacterium sp. SD291 TaxID=2782007 RepID=UPI001A9656BF|nr:CsbD family protein [Microbacterium sp. SD291]MBO0980800.1 CsbD family protein [Microbacterium sp. SD291]
MSGADDMKHAAEKMAGKVKEGAGKVTDNEDLEREGRMDQAKASAKQAGEDVKDAAHDAGDNVKDAFRE